MELGIVGEDRFTLGFKLAGITRVFPTTPTTVQKVIENALRDREVGILVISDADAKLLPPAFRKRLANSVYPVVISVGRVDEEDLREKIRKAIGVDLYKSK